MVVAFVLVEFVEMRLFAYVFQRCESEPRFCPEPAGRSDVPFHANSLKLVIAPDVKKRVLGALMLFVNTEPDALTFVVEASVAFRVTVLFVHVNPATPPERSAGVPFVDV